MLWGSKKQKRKCVKMMGQMEMQKNKPLNDFNQLIKSINQYMFLLIQI